MGHPVATLIDRYRNDDAMAQAAAYSLNRDGSVQRSLGVVVRIVAAASAREHSQHQ